jgi:hypothetical protein
MTPFAPVADDDDAIADWSGTMFVERFSPDFHAVLLLLTNCPAQMRCRVMSAAAKSIY